MNFFKTLIFSIFILCFLANNIFAVSNIETVLNKESIEFSEEKDEVISIFNNAFSETADALIDMGITDVKNYKNNKMYKVYNIKIEEFNSGKKFNQSVHDLSSW